MGPATQHIATLLVEWEYGDQSCDVVEIQPTVHGVVNVPVTNKVPNSKAVFEQAGTQVIIECSPRLVANDLTTLLPHMPDENGVEQDFQFFKVQAVPFTTVDHPDNPSLPVRPGVPTITSIQPEQFTLQNADSSIFVAWSVSDVCDKYHFMWTDRTPTPRFAGGWNAIEFTARGSHGFATRIPKTSIGTTYTFKVQGCKAMDLGSDLCGPFCADSDIRMPGNTHSLRDFLRLSKVPLPAGVRSLGTSVFGAGLRAMMRL